MKKILQKAVWTEGSIRLRLQVFLDNQHTKVVRLLALQTGHYMPPPPPGDNHGTLSVRC